ncbi:DNA-binding protein [Spirillospora sp. NPDC127200]
MRPGLTAADIRRLPAMVDLVTAGHALGIGRTKSYQLARTGQFPCRVLRMGRNYRVLTADLLAFLGLTDQSTHACLDQPKLGQRAPHRKEG